MGRFITIKDVAERAGTSCCTVSYVLSGKEGRYISAETRARVEKAVKELNYVKSRSASVLKGEKTNLIAIIVPQFDNLFFTRIVSFAEKVLVKNGYDIVIFNTSDNHEREMENIHRAMQLRVDGVIITPTPQGSEALKMLDDISIPYIVADRKINHTSTYAYVVSDNYSAGRLAAKRLLDAGHRCIGYVGWESGLSCLEERRQAILDVYGSSGTVITEYASLSFHDGYLATERLISEHPDVSAIIYGFNLQAGGGIKYLYEKGISIPSDLSAVIIGTPQWTYVGGEFDRIYMGERELGNEAAQSLLALIAGVKPKDEIHYLQECHVTEGFTVERRSV